MEIERKANISHFRKTGETAPKKEPSKKQRETKTIAAKKAGLGSADTYIKAKEIVDKAKAGDFASSGEIRSQIKPVEARSRPEWYQSIP